MKIIVKETLIVSTNLGPRQPEYREFIEYYHKDGYVLLSVCGMGIHVFGVMEVSKDNDDNIQSQLGDKA